MRGRVDFAQRCCNDLYLRMLLGHRGHHGLEDRRVELRFGLHVRAGDAETLLQVFFVAYQHVDVGYDSVEHFDGLGFAAENLPELGAEVEVEADDGPGGLGGLHAFDDDLGRRRRQRREDAAGVEPAHAAREDLFPIEVAGLELSGCFIGAVIEHDRPTHAEAAV
jgi:hypothetical protein